MAGAFTRGLVFLFLLIWLSFLASPFTYPQSSSARPCEHGKVQLPVQARLQLVAPSQSHSRTCPATLSIDMWLSVHVHPIPHGTLAPVPTACPQCTVPSVPSHLSKHVTEETTSVRVMHPLTHLKSTNLTTHEGYCRSDHADARTRITRTARSPSPRFPIPAVCTASIDIAASPLSLHPPSTIVPASP